MHRFTFARQALALVGMRRAVQECLLLKALSSERPDTPDPSPECADLCLQSRHPAWIMDTGMNARAAQNRCHSDAP